jgi:helicase
VFTETRREAMGLADEFSAQSQRTAEGLVISQQLELFCEPTESLQQLKSHAERRVTFHSADLTPDEKVVIEAGFGESSFDVCFATSTLAAGVNFPFRTVIIAKLTYSYGDREGKLFDRSDFRNMSGRAGRLGHHDDGRVILLPLNDNELRHANKLVLPENDRINSQLVTLSMNRTVLSLVSARVVSTKAELAEFFANTYCWHQVAEHNPRLLDRIGKEAISAIDWLVQKDFLEESHSTIQATPLGKSTSLSGLLPETAERFVVMLNKYRVNLQKDFARYEAALIHWASSCPEFSEANPSRFLPYPAGRMKPECSAFLQSVPHLTAWDRTDERLTRCVHAMHLFIQGEVERKITYATGVSAGNIHRLSLDISWVLDGLCCISSASDLNCPQTLTNQVAMLARRVRWGTPVEAIDLLRIANRNGVPGFGRQRVMALIANGLKTVMDVIRATGQNCC